MKEKAKKGTKKIFSKLTEKAKGMVKSNDQLKKMLEEVNSKLQDLPLDRRIKNSLGLIQTFIRMIRNYINGNYRTIPWRTLIYVTAALLYFLMPLDFIPDFTPFAGYLDDMTVIIWVAGSIKEDLDDYMEWETQKVSPQQE
jgi:uncharacterized membrane protein YkvA (DUF1232 family)